MVNHLETVEEFDDALKANIIVVDFYADWCGPCKRIAPDYVKLAKRYPNVDFYKVNVENAEELSEKYQISALPTFLIFKDSIRVEEQVGANLGGLEFKLENL